MAETTPKSGAKRPQPAKKARAKAKPARNRTGARSIIIAGVAVLAIAALIGGGVVWQQHAQSARIASGEQRDRINDRVDDIEKRLATFLTRQEKLSEQSNNAETTRQQMRAELRALSDAVSALRTETSRNDERLGVDEVERLLVIANQRLQLSADPRLAGKALQLADQRLQRLADSTLAPALAPVREMIADEIAALSDQQPVDVAGTLHALAALAASADALPLLGAANVDSNADANADANTDTNTDSSDGAAWLWDSGKNLLADLGALVQVETDGKPSAPLLSAERRQLIYQKTALILESCQLAFLRADQEVYAARMRAAKNWVTANFDTESAQVNAWLARWAVLAAVAPAAQLPDISGSLQALRAVMQ